MSLTLALALSQFLAGELVLASRGLNVGGNVTAGVVRIDLFAGTTHLVKTFTDLRPCAAFDPYRGGVVLGAIGAGYLPGGEIVVLDDAGAVTKLGIPAGGLAGLAPAENGRLYYVSGTGAIRYLDALNGTHDLLDAAGAAPYVFKNDVYNTLQLYFDAATHSLFVGTQNSSMPCTGTVSWVSAVFRVPLNGDGTKVGGPVQGTVVCLSGGVGWERPNGFSEGPNGTLFLTVDDNSNAAVGRMVTIDKTTLAVSTYATNGPYIGAASSNAGVYSRLLGRGVLLDTSADVLRLFTAGESGGGTPWASGGLISGPGGGELAALVEVPDTTASGLAPYGSGTPGCAGLQVLGATTQPKVGAADFRLTCTHAPPSALGLLLVGDVPLALGSDPFALGILLHVDLLLSSFVLPLDLTSNAFGLGASPAPIPLSAPLAGVTFYAQAIWAWGGCANLSSSCGLAITVSP